MLDELSETTATGEIAEIYQRIRETTRVPYVSSLQRHFATRPGHLEWMWRVIGDAFSERRVQTIGWSVCNAIELPRLTERRPSLHNVDKLSEAEKSATKAKLANVYRSFIRVSPTNLVVSCILKHRLDPTRSPSISQGSDLHVTETVDLPPMLDALPAMVNTSEQQDPVRSALLSLSTVVGEKEFVPGLYRMLANWPDYLVEVADSLAKVRQSKSMDTILQQLPLDLDLFSLQLEKSCPDVTPPVVVGSSAANELIDVIDSYRQTSPEMIIYSRLLLEQLLASSDDT